MMDILPLLEGLGLSDIKAGQREISARCPAHQRITGKPDSHPSWSISRATGLHICYSCGWKGTIASLFEEMGVEAPADLDMELMSAAVSAGLEHYAAEREPERVYTQAAPMIVDMPWLRNFPPMPQSLLALKHLTPEAAQRFDLRWDSEGMRWVIPIKAPDGSLWGVQYRSSTGHPVNYPPEIEKSNTLFGFDVISRLHTTYVLLVESPLDVVRCWTASVPAVASFGVYVSEVQMELLARHFTFVVVGLDNPAIDIMGNQQTPVVIQRLGRRGVPALPFRYAGLTKADGSPAKDPGDVADSVSLHAAWSRSLSVAA